jgi:hypothetical protein
MGGGGSWNIQPAGEDLVGTSNQEARRRGGVGVYVDVGEDV